MDGIPETDKRRVLEALLLRLHDDLETLEASQHAAQAGATHEEARPEHAKDTRAIEATYLARGLAERAEALRDSIRLLGSVDPAPLGSDARVAIASLVTLEDQETGVRGSYLMVPAGGGEKLLVEGVVVQTLTPVSRLGHRLMGREQGDEIALARPSGELRAILVDLR